MRPYRYSSGWFEKKKKKITPVKNSNFSNERFSPYHSRVKKGAGVVIRDCLRVTKQIVRSDLHARAYTVKESLEKPTRSLQNHPD